MVAPKSAMRMQRDRSLGFSIPTPLPTLFHKQCSVTSLTFQPRSKCAPISASLKEVNPHWLPQKLNLPSGSLFHLFRDSPPHLSPAKHSVDGDAYILALTVLPDGKAFLRGRYVRTTEFLREQRAGKRLYLSRLGTEPDERRYRKLKAACADGVFVWGDRLFAWSTEKSLPMRLEPSMLVSRGYSALGSALSDEPELERDRGTTLVAPPALASDGNLCLCARSLDSRTMFISDIDTKFKVVRRLPPTPFSSDAIIFDFAVTSSYYVLLCGNFEKSESNPLNPFNAFRNVMVGEEKLRNIDTSKGVFLAVIPRNQEFLAKPQMTTIEIPNLAGNLPAKFVSVKEQSVDEILVDVLNVSNVKPSISVGELADYTTANEAEGQQLPGMKRLSYTVQVASKSALKADSESHSIDAPTRSISECKRYASVASEIPGDGMRIARVNDGGYSDVLWTETDCVNISGIMTMNKEKVVSALVTRRNGEAVLRFWDADTFEQLDSIDISANRFGPVPYSWMASWSSICPKYPEGGKTVRSTFELFEDKNWNDINSSFSSLGINQ